MRNSLIRISERSYLVLTGTQKHLKLSYACAFLEKMQHCWPKADLTSLPLAPSSLAAGTAGAHVAPPRPRHLGPPARHVTRRLPPPQAAEFSLIEIINNIAIKSAFYKLDETT